MCDVCLKYDQNDVDVYFENHCFSDAVAFNDVYVNVSALLKMKHVLLLMISSKNQLSEFCFCNVLNFYICCVETKMSLNFNLKLMILIIIISDNVMTDMKNVLVDVARSLNACCASSNQLDIQFLQIEDDHELMNELIYYDENLFDEYDVCDIFNTVC